jgi:ATP-binding cassette subfamily B protein
VTAPDTLPEAWQGEVSAQLAPDEQLLAWLELDLDERLDFRPACSC